MPKFELRPPVVEAVQWDGTEEGSDKLLELLRYGSSLRVGFHLRVDYDQGSSPRYRIIFNDRHLFTNGQLSTSPMLPHDWLVKTFEGGLQILRPDEFQRLYKEIPDDED